MAAEAGDLELRQITELQQIFLRRDLDLVLLMGA